MRTTEWWIPAVLLGILFPCFIGYLVYSFGQLPERTATHFDLRGRGNRRMNRVWYLLLMFALGLAISVPEIAITFMARSTPSGLHIPNRDYWLAPDRLEQTFAYLIGHSLWFACLVMSFVAGLHTLIVRANQKEPPRISIWWVLLWVGCFVTGVFAWERGLTRHFSQIG